MSERSRLDRINAEIQNALLSLPTEPVTAAEFLEIRLLRTLAEVALIARYTVGEVKNGRGQTAAPTQVSLHASIAATTASLHEMVQTGPDNASNRHRVAPEPFLLAPEAEEPEA